MENLLMYLRALPFQTPRQILGRLTFPFRRRMPLPTAYKADRARAAALKTALAPGLPEEVEFSFLNRARRYPLHGVNWEEPGEEKLWRYHLNYFDFLHHGFPVELCLFLALDWIEKNMDDCRGPWEPFATSRRVAALAGWLEANREAFAGHYDALKMVRATLFAQLARLERDMEYHGDANHLLENYRALALGANSLDSGTGDMNEDQRLGRWRERGFRGLAGEVKKQVLPDGAHYELSPMYHRLIMTELAALAPPVKRGAFPAGPESLEEVTHRMREWLSALTHPDGEIALFGDSAFRSYPELREKPGFDGLERALILPSSGYAVVSRRAPVPYYCAVKLQGPSPPHQPGHSHGDVLSYELSVGAMRVVVDSGCGSYQDPLIRRRCRSTEAHNVPCLAGSEQSEFFSSFGVARRARVLRRSFVHEEGGFVVEGEFRDYGGTLFYRRMRFGERGIAVEDRVERRGCSGNDFESLLHFGPSVECRSDDERSLTVRWQGGMARVQSEHPYVREDSFYYPEFGRELKNQVIRFRGGRGSSIAYTLSFEVTV
jgi:hypothetical protein